MDSGGKVRLNRGEKKGEVERDARGPPTEQDARTLKVVPRSLGYIQTIRNGLIYTWELASYSLSHQPSNYIDISF